LLIQNVFLPNEYEAFLKDVKTIEWEQDFITLSGAPNFRKPIKHLSWNFSWDKTIEGTVYIPFFLIIKGYASHYEETRCGQMNVHFAHISEPTWMSKPPFCKIA
jgi:hypothetical protein